MNMTFAGANSREDVYVLHGLRTPLLGKPAIEKLGVLPQVNVVKKLEPESDFPQVFRGLGTFKGEYDLKLNPEAKPFALSSPRRVPPAFVRKNKTGARADASTRRHLSCHRAYYMVRTYGCRS
ncbi:hypothetical protein MTO96_026619 [Rhipicephalus appendiculatus]